MAKNKTKKKKYKKPYTPKWVLEQYSHMNSIRDEIKDQGRSILYGKGL